MRPHALFLRRGQQKPMLVDDKRVAVIADLRLLHERAQLGKTHFC